MTLAANYRSSMSHALSTDSCFNLLYTSCWRARPSSSVVCRCGATVELNALMWATWFAIISRLCFDGTDITYVTNKASLLVHYKMIRRVGTDFILLWLTLQIHTYASVAKIPEQKNISTHYYRGRFPVPISSTYVPTQQSSYGVVVTGVLGSL
jgi:hypothetical protein